MWHLNITTKSLYEEIVFQITNQQISKKLKNKLERAHAELEVLVNTVLRKFFLVTPGYSFFKEDNY